MFKIIHIMLETYIFLRFKINRANDVELFSYLMISLPLVTFVKDFFSILNIVYYHNECRLGLILKLHV